MAIIDELLVALGYDYDDKGVKEFSKDLEKTVNVVRKFVKWAAAGATAITGLTVATTAASDEQGKLAAEIGVSVGELDALQFAARRAGGTAEGMARGLQELSKRAGEAARGVGSGVEAFGLLGISVHDSNGNLKNTSQLFREVSGRIQGLSKGTQLELLDKLGLKDNVRLLQAGAGEIANLTAEARALGVTTAEDAAIAAEFQDSLTDIWQVTKQLSRILVRVFAPVLKDINLRLTEWWKNNKTFIEQNMPMYIERITLALKILSATMATLIALKFAQSLVTLVSLLRAVGVAGAFAAAGPLALVAIVAALVIAIQDIYTYTQGGDSIFGRLLEKFPAFKTAVEGAVNLVKTLWSWVKKIGELWDKIVEAKDKTVQFFKDRGFTQEDRSAELGFNTGYNGFQDPSLTGRPANNSNAEQNIQITVNGAGDPEAIANYVVRQITRQTRQEFNGPVEQ
jgi:hypothetical protein